MALRDPDRTRTNIVEVAGAIFHQKGFKGTSLSDILSEAKISKGALYHHFSNKQELLYAVFDELYQDNFLKRWNNITTADDPINEIINVVKSWSLEGSDEEMCSGCPVHNLSAELASVDENIRHRVDGLFCRIQQIISQGIDKAKANGDVSDSVDSKQVSLFFMCAMSGIPQVVKSCQDREVFAQLTSALSDYIYKLKQK